ncbi:MAG: polyprenyl synthetase family protein [Clostridia bacterium]|nr:polyprenyl synthetase family protein [Clostridia bacterium]
MLQRIEDALERALPQDAAIPQPLLSAMRHSLSGGGKRMRPRILLVACTHLGGSEEQALPFAVALEMIHTYSLIHDDLPCMDDDAVRRGQPTCHILYGEAMALLAGDGLQGLAAEILVRNIVDEKTRAAAHCILTAAGVTGMIAGQCKDISGDLNLPEDEFLMLHIQKTAALFSAALRAGGLLAGVSAFEAEALRRAGLALGLCFQITDDLLDAADNEDEGKLTFVARYGVEESKKMAQATAKRAVEALTIFGERLDAIQKLALLIPGRTI